jgi:glycosyltransferase involved in cell wall biosynthesis
MRIGIDARFYGPKVGGGGLGRYVKELLEHLQETDTQNRYVVFLNKEGFSSFTPKNPNFEKKLADVRWYTLSEQLLMPRLIDRERLDIMHYPHWNVPVLTKTPFLVTIHDLILLDEKKSANRATTLPSSLYKIKYLGYKFVLWRAVKASRKIVTVSEFVRGQIVKNFPKAADKIEVVYEGVSSMPMSQEQENIQTPKQPYILYVGNAFPHKNLESLLHAFSFFHKAHNNVRLVLTGNSGVFHEALKKELEEIDVPKDSVIFTGFVDEETLAGLYKHASLYVFPSRNEGFGLPPLEAMSHGVPVAASNAASIPEILGDAAMYFDPDDIEEMVRVMEKSVSDNELREKMICKGYEQIKKYSWTTTAEKMIAIYSSC